MFPPTHPDRLRRREFIGLGAASVAGAWLAACGRDAVSPLVAPLAGKATTTRYPLRIPSTTSPSGLTLGAASGSVDVGGGSSSALRLLFSATKLPKPLALLP